jgi:serine/threonine protein kinase
MSDQRWRTVTPSPYPWEREALEFIRQGLPDHDPYQAWALLEFPADDGSLNEIDLLVLSPAGFYLVEIKSWPGVLTGDLQNWVVEHEGRTRVYDAPLFLANRKAKRLKGILQRQRAAAGTPIPFVQPLIFLSHPDIEVKLEGLPRQRVCVRDLPAQGDRPARPGILKALTTGEVTGLRLAPAEPIRRPLAKVVLRAMDQLKIGQSGRARRLGDYELGNLLYESSGGVYQDFLATHITIPTIKRRARVYLVARTPGSLDRDTIRRAAEREFRILQGLQHPGFVKPDQLTEHELGPALLFDHQDGSVRLDQYLREKGPELSQGTALDILRQVAEVVRYAHRKRIVHRALCPRSVLVRDPKSPNPQVQILDWQIGSRGTESTEGGTLHVSATRHVEELVEDTAALYRAPEFAADTDEAGEQLDVFSLGALAWHLLTKQPPADTPGALWETLRDGGGLDLTAVLDGVPEELRDLVLLATHPNVSRRFDSAEEFLKRLDAVEERLTRPAEEPVVHPLEAKPNDRIGQGFTVRRRLGSGGTAVALEVEKEGTISVLKVARTPEVNARVQAEGEVLAKLRHPRIVAYYETLEIAGHTAIRTPKAGDETLAHRLRDEGTLSLDLLQRFGEDLLEAVAHLEAVGIPHRDIKPDNLGIGPFGKNDELHLALFDFSLARARLDDIDAGTDGYIEPFLKLRRPPRWDLHAERWAAAIVLYQMATGALPRWGDGKSDPALVECDATIDAASFDPSIRDPLAAFFAKSFQRNPGDRFDSTESLRLAWRQVFVAAAAPHRDPATIEADRAAVLARATMTTLCAELPLSARALNACERIGVVTVGDLLRAPLAKINLLRGVGNKTRQEISQWSQDLRVRFPQVPAQVPMPEEPAEAEQVDAYSIDALLPVVLLPDTSRNRDTLQTLRAALGLESDHWPSQTEAAKQRGKTATAISLALAAARRRWRKAKAITALRTLVQEILIQQGGVASVEELTSAVLAARGSTELEPMRTRSARAVLRAAVEAEGDSADPRYLIRRHASTVLVAGSSPLADYGLRLGAKADELACSDPLPSPSRAVTVLSKVTPPECVPPLSDARLLRLAVAASKSAALSSRQEIYPRGLDARRALQLAQGSLFFGEALGEEELRRRVRLRYPQAQALPFRPQLDRWIEDLRLELEWDPLAHDGRGGYTSRLRSGSSLTTWLVRDHPTAATPEADLLSRCRERLRQASREGAFLVLLTTPGRHRAVEAALMSQHHVNPVHLEKTLIDEMRQVAAAAKVDWSVVLRTDAAGPMAPDWPQLLTLVKRAVPAVTTAVVAAGKEATVLATYPGLLARYGQMELLEQLRDRTGRALADGHLQGLWVLIAANEQSSLPQIDSVPLPVIGSSQWLRLPSTFAEETIAV